MMSFAKNTAPLPFSTPAASGTQQRCAAEIYSREYYLRHFDPPYSREQSHWLEFFGKIADEIVSRLKPRTVLDMGCAHGFLVESLRDRGVEAFGVDISDYAISQVREDIERFCSLGSAADPIHGHYDLITCIELCEHLTEFEARSAIRNMTGHSDAVLFSSTPTDVSEPTHINVRPLIYWLRAFREYSFAPDTRFDVSFVSPQAMLLRRSAQRPSDGEMQDFAEARTRAVAAIEGRSQTELAELRGEIDRLQRELDQASENLEKERQRSRSLEEELVDRNEELAARTATLSSLLSSRGWRFLTRFRDLRNLAMQNELLRRFARVVFRRINGSSASDREYQRWIELREQPSIDVPAITRAIGEFKYKPKFSILMPVYNTAPAVLDAAIQSVRAQYYEDWELCICNDGSTTPHIRPTLDGWAERDSRIKITHAAANQGISAASNRALELATGEFVGLLDHDDELSPDALYENAKLLQTHADADMIYSDEDKLAEDGHRIDPFFKPDWSPEYFLACMYTCHFGVYRKSLVEQIGGFRRGFEGSQDYDLVLRLTEKADKIYHIPRVLYHWRMVAGSAATSRQAKPYAYVAARRAITQHLQRCGISGEVKSGKWQGHYWIKFNPEPVERVSIIIPTRDRVRLLRSCIDSIEKKTTYRNYEIIVLDNGSSEPQTKQYLSVLPHRVIPIAEPFNYSRLVNYGARAASGKFLLLLNNDTEVISPDWIEAMLGFCQQKEIGVVGAKLLYRNNRIQHAGIVLGLGGIAGHPLRYFPRNTATGFGVACDLRNYSAVTAACMMLRKDVFEQVGGFDEKLSVAYNDVDFSLRVREAGYRIVWTPYAELYHYESASRGFSQDSGEIAYFQKRWGRVLKHDPYYSPNLTLQREDFSYRI